MSARDIELQATNQARLPTRYGDFTAKVFPDPVDGSLHHLALVHGDLDGQPPPLVRLHSECLTGDVFGSLRCDCGEQLHEAIRLITEAERGILLYLRQEGRGIGLENKIRAYSLQDRGLDTVEANHHLGFPDDLRDYHFAGEILRSLGIQRLQLLTNNPRKMSALEEQGLLIVERKPLVVPSNAENEKYLATKRFKLGHMLVP
ncbi:MAG: GTP cyclohydrolase II [Holophagales bacterium]|nr:GTP cyclohydrolase II [Holophagales bacterium]